MTQPDRLNRLFGNAEFRDGGLLPRFLVVNRPFDIAEIPKTVPRIDSNVQYKYHAMITGLLERFWDSDHECLIPESPETYEEMRQYYVSRRVNRMARQTKPRKISASLSYRVATRR